MLLECNHVVGKCCLSNCLLKIRHSFNHSRLFVKINNTVGLQSHECLRSVAFIAFVAKFNSKNISEPYFNVKGYEFSNIFGSEIVKLTNYSLQTWDIFSYE